MTEHGAVGWLVGLSGAVLKNANNKSITGGSAVPAVSDLIDN